jgi:hypothetical protein
MACYRDATMFKVAYSYGLRFNDRREIKPTISLRHIVICWLGALRPDQLVECGLGARQRQPRIGVTGLR